LAHQTNHFLTFQSFERNSGPSCGSGLSTIPAAFSPVIHKASDLR
jgi:hypothetical protein